MISTAAAPRPIVSGSPRTATPAAKAPTAPMPVHTVYAVPSGGDFIEIDSSPKLASIVNSVTTDAPGRVKPAESFIVKAQTISSMARSQSEDPARIAVADTMAYDFAVMGDISRGGTIPEELVRAIAIPTLVLAGGASPDFFRETAERIAALLEHGQYVLLAGQDHGVSPRRA